MNLNPLGQLKASVVSLVRALLMVWMTLQKRLCSYWHQNKADSTALNFKKALAANKALMGEIVLEKLLFKMMKAVLETSQATKGYIILVQEKRLEIATAGMGFPHEYIQLQAIPLEDSNEVPLSVIQRVAQIKSSVLINTPASRSEFANDTYIYQYPLSSIFCLPLIGKQDKLTAIIYIEITAQGHEFSDNQIELLQLMSAPAALCINNAQLYKQLGDYSCSLETAIEELRKAQQISQGQTAALSNTLNALTQEPELDSFAEKVLAAVTGQLNAPSSVLWLYNANDMSITHYMTHLGSSALQRDTAIAATPPVTFFPQGSEHPFWQRFIGNPEPVHVLVQQNQALELEWRQWLAAQNVRSLLVVPISTESTCLGFLNIWSHQVDPFLSEQVELATALAKQVSLAIQLSKLSAQSRSAAVLTERNRLAQEIHDTLAQTLSGISIQADVAQRIIQAQPAEASKLLGQMAASARQGLVEAKQSVWELQPEMQGCHDLSQALSSHLRQTTADTDIQAELRVQGEARDFTPEETFNLLRIGQEALTNIFKHTQAKTIWVDLIFTETQFQLRVRDDGQGFDSQTLTGQEGFGLIAMKQRAEKLGGQFQVSSRPGQGTEIIVNIFDQQTHKQQTHNQ